MWIFPYVLLWNCGPTCEYCEKSLTVIGNHLFSHSDTNKNCIKIKSELTDPFRNEIADGFYGLNHLFKKTPGYPTYNGRNSALKY